MQDTIYALSSGQGRAAVAVIRISGPAARRAFELFQTPCPQPRRAKVINLVDPQDGGQIDQALALWFPGPRSFTGQDMVELQVHGGRAVVTAVFDVLARCDGFRLAEPGEFTRRAFENGKLGLHDAEGIADLIDADTRWQRKQAVWLMSGGVGEMVASWRAALLEASALIEASIDFSDEGEIGETVVLQASAGIDGLIVSLTAGLAREGAAEILRDGFVVLLAGRPNAGKSTLLNALAQREVAITSEFAGTTRDLIEIKIDIDGLPVIVIDTAGLHATSDPVERIGIERTRKRAAQANLVLWLSAAHAPSAPDLLGDLAGEVVQVTSMADLAPTGCADGGLTVSAVTGDGVAELLAFVARRARAAAGVDEPVVVLQRRHHDSAVAMLQACRAARDLLGKGQAELAVEELRNAMTHLRRIAEPIRTDDVLDLIFGRFCLGK